MEGAYFAVKNYAATLSETSVHLRVDNTAILTWINKQPPPNQNVLYFWKFCAAKIIGVHASYISSSRNNVADKESIKLTDNLEWSLKEKFFEKIVGNFGPVATDSCTSSVNCKASLYTVIPMNQKPLRSMLSPITVVMKIFIRFSHLP